LGRRPSNLRRSYGYHRFQVLAAFSNGLTLVFIALWICVEALRRFRDPVEILAGPMLVIAVLGLLVNLVVLAILRSGHASNLNVRGAATHVMSDVLGSLAAIGASAVILTTGWTPIDPLLSIFVALLILRAAWGLIRESGHILLEGTPENVDPEEVGRRLEAAIPPIAEVHHVHIWSLTGERPVLTLHAVLEEDADHDEALRRIHGALEELFGVSHATIQIEYRTCPDHPVAPPETGSSAA
jgi:cobalt-zinc-cadmium efflux system protein